MNEERSKEERATGATSPEEFARMRGEVQLRGQRVLAVPAPAPNIPVGIAPPDPRNVVSNFDTRPIGAYDFMHTEHVTMGNGEVSAGQTVEFAVPDGYTAVLRRLRIEFTPPAAMLVAQPLAASTPADTFLISLLRNGGVIPNNTMTLLGDLDLIELATHQVFGFWETMGVSLVQNTTFAIPAAITDAVFVAVTFFGTLIPTKSRPPETEIASDPVIVRDYETLVNEPPETGAAGS